MPFKRRSYKLQTVRKEESQNKENKSNRDFAWKGLIFAAVSASIYSIDAVLVKSVKNLHPIQITLYRFIILFLMNIPDVVKMGENPFGPRDVRLFLLIRGALGGINIFFAYTSFRLLPLGETFIIISSLPIIVTFAAHIFLKEPCGIFQAILVVFTVMGIIFTTKVPSRLIGKYIIYTTENIYGILAAIGVLISRTLMVLSIRKAKKVDNSVMMFNYCWVSLIECFILFPVLTDFKFHECGIQGIYILLIGILSYGGQTFLNLSLKCEFAGPVTNMMAAVNIILAFLWQTVIFQDIPDYFTITGAVIVIFCIILTSLKKWVSALPEDSLQYKKWRWMMV